MEKVKRKRGNRLAFPIGLLVVLFAVIGLVCIVMLGVDKIKDIANDTAEKEQYESYLSSIVMNDPDPFDDVTKADMSQLLAATIWTLLEDNETDKYEYDNGTLLLPQKDVEKQFKKLFGSDVKPAHQTIEGNSYEFAYDKSVQAYRIPITGVTPTYTPKVLDIEKKSNTIILTVGYLSGSEWTQDKNGDMVEPQPSKYVKITLRENENKSYYISALQITSAPEEAA